MLPIKRLLVRVAIRSLGLIAAAGLLGTMSSLAGCAAFSTQVSAPRDNQKLGQQVADKICASGLSDHANIQVQASSGAIVLRGIAASDAQAMAITQCARDVAGVAYVDNRLRVRQRDEGGLPPRRTLIENVREALEMRLPRRGPRLVVDADGGVVYLSGIVPDDHTRSAALQVALNVPGVSQVHDNLLSEMP